MIIIWIDHCKCSLYILPYLFYNSLSSTHQLCHVHLRGIAFLKFTLKFSPPNLQPKASPHSDNYFSDYISNEFIFIKTCYLLLPQNLNSSVGKVSSFDRTRPFPTRLNRTLVSDEGGDKILPPAKVPSPRCLSLLPHFPTLTQSLPDTCCTAKHLSSLNYKIIKPKNPRHRRCRFLPFLPWQWVPLLGCQSASESVSQATKRWNFYINKPILNRVGTTTIKFHHRRIKAS